MSDSLDDAYARAFGAASTKQTTRRKMQQTQTAEKKPTPKANALDTAYKAAFAPQNTTAAGEGNEHKPGLLEKISDVLETPFAAGNAMQRSRLAGQGEFGGPFQDFVARIRRRDFVGAANEYGLNTPSELQYQATHRDPLMPFAQSVSRYEQNHPMAAGADTFLTEFFNPSNALVGGAVGAGARALKPVAGAAARNVPAIGKASDAFSEFFNRFHRMNKTAGSEGESWQRRLLNDLHSASKDVRDKARAIFGALPPEQQIEVERASQGAAVASPEIAQRGSALRSDITQRARRVVQAEPSMKARMFESVDSPHFLPMKNAYEQKPGAELLANLSPGLYRGMKPIGNAHKVYSTIDEAVNSGETLAPDFLPAKNFTSDALKKERGIVRSRAAHELAGIQDTQGNPLLAELQYHLPDKTGNLQVFGAGEAGAKAARNFASREALQKAQERAIKDAVAASEIPSEAYGRMLLATRLGNVSALRGAVTGATKGSKRLLTSGNIATRGAMQAANAMNPQKLARSLAYDVDRGSAFKTGLGRDIDRRIVELAKQRFDKPAYTSGSVYMDAEGQTHTLGNINPPRGYANSAFTKADVEELTRQIRKTTGSKTFTTKQTRDLLDAAFNAIGKRTTRKQTFESILQPAQTDVARAGYKTADKVFDQSKKMQADTAALKAKYQTLKAQRADKDLLQSRARDLAPSIANDIFKRAEHVAAPGHVKASGLGIDSLQYHSMHDAAYKALEEAGAPPKEGGAIADFIGSINAFARAGIIANPIIHGVWNLGNQFLAAGGPVSFFAKDVWKEPDASWLARAEKQGAIVHVTPRRLGLAPESQAELDTLPFGKLTTRGKIDKAFSKVLEANSNLVFEKMEKRYSVALFKHFVQDLRIPEHEAGTMVRKALGDYANISDAERAAMLDKVFFFYPWMKTTIPFWTKMGALKPQSWNAPLRGVQTSNAARGSKGTSNPFSLSLGNDKNGNERFLTLPLPQRVLDTIANTAGAPFSGEGLKGLQSPANYLEGHLTPLLGNAIDVLTTLRSKPAIPGGANYRTAFDLQAPASTQRKQLMQHVLGTFAYPLRQGAAIGKDPAAALGIIPGGFYHDQPSEDKLRTNAIIEAVYRKAIGKLLRAGDTKGAAQQYNQMLKMLQTP